MNHGNSHGDGVANSHENNHLQAFWILLARYLIAFTPPTANRPDTACLALEIITLRFKTFCMHFAASSLEGITSSVTGRPAMRHTYFNVHSIWELNSYTTHCIFLWQFTAYNLSPYQTRSDIYSLRVSSPSCFW